MTLLTRSFALRASHVLKGEGACTRVHGHDYRIEVTVHGEPDRKSGLSIDRDHMREVVESRLIAPLDKTYLNESFETTTGEALCKEFFEILKSSEIGSQLFSVAIQETAKNRFEYLP